MDQGVVVAVESGETEQACPAEPELTARLERIEKNLATVLDVMQEGAAVHEWRSNLSAWLQAEHEQVELLSTILLGLSGLMSIAKQPNLPDPPAWPPS